MEHINDLWNHFVLLYGIYLFSFVEIYFVELCREIVLIFTVVRIDPHFDPSISVDAHHLWPDSKVPVFFVEFLEPLKHAANYIHDFFLLYFSYLVESDRYPFDKYPCIFATATNSHAFF